jgi:hypothetical protein
MNAYNKKLLFFYEEHSKIMFYYLHEKLSYLIYKYL